MSIGFHFDDIEEAYFKSRHEDWDSVPIGAPYHDKDYDNKEKRMNELPPMGAPYHD